VSIRRWVMENYEPRESVVDEPQIDYPATVDMLRRAIAEKDTEIAELQAMADQLDAVLLGNDPEYSTLKAALAEKELEIERLKEVDHAYYEVGALNDKLKADLDQVVGKVVQFASAIEQDMVRQADRNDAKEVLASPLVQSWQARQQEGKG